MCRTTKPIHQLPRLSLCPRGLCPGGLCLGGVSVWRVSFRGVSVRGVLSGEFLSRWVSVQGDLSGGFLSGECLSRETPPPPRYRAGGTHPAGMHSCNENIFKHTLNLKCEISFKQPSAASSPSNGWYWFDNAPYSYTNWQPDQPSNDEYCAVASLDTENSQWTVQGCSFGHGMACKSPKSKLFNKIKKEVQYCSVD